MQAIVGIGIFICTSVLRRTTRQVRGDARSKSAETSAASTTGVPGVLSQVKLNRASSFSFSRTPRTPNASGEAAAGSPPATAPTCSGVSSFCSFSARSTRASRLGTGTLTEVLANPRSIGPSFSRSRSSPAAASSTDMMTNGDHATATRRGVSGTVRSAIPTPALNRLATASSASATYESFGSFGSGVCPAPAWAAGNFHSSFGRQTNFRNSARQTSEKMLPPMSVIGQTGGSPRPQACIVAKVYWNSANDPPPTSSAGQTANVCRHVHMTLTMYSGIRHDRNGSWCPHMTLMASAGSPEVLARVSTGVPSPP